MIAKLMISAALCFPLFGVSPSHAQESNQNDVDRSARPGDDFYRYANGGWLRTAVIPAGQKSFDTRTILRERTTNRVRSLIQDSAASNATKGSLTQKVGDYYASFMDQGAIETKGLTPLAG